MVRQIQELEKKDRELGDKDIEIAKMRRELEGKEREIRDLGTTLEQLRSRQSTVEVGALRTHCQG